MPRTKRPTSSSVGRGNKREDVASLLGKLNGSQLVEVVGKCAEVAQSGFDLLKEKERTQQVNANVGLGLKQVDADKKAAVLNYESKIKELQYDDTQNQRNHIERMSELSTSGEVLNNENSQIMRILGMVENGDIPANELVDLVNQIKSKG